jgi:phosphoglycolate phosphatase
LRLRILVLGLRRFGHYVFDLDGTLVDSAKDLAESANAALSDVGRGPLSQQAVLGFVGQGVRRLVARCLAAAGGPPEETDAVLAAFLRHYEEHLVDHTRLYGGVGETLAALCKDGAALSVLTNKPGPLARRLLLGLGVSERFFAIVGGGDGFAAKPDPAGARELMARSGVPSDRTLFVGDSHVDIETARAAGTPVCAVGWGFSARGDLEAATPDFLIDEISALL